MLIASIRDVDELKWDATGFTLRKRLGGESNSNSSMWHAKEDVELDEALNVLSFPEDQTARMARSMAGFPSVVHNIKDITIGSDSWNLKVKVLHIWSPPDAYNLVDFSCLEMILIDGEGTRIEACLPSYLMKRYNMDIVEERLYHFRTFSVVPNTGPYKATPHKYKLIFVKETEISLAEPFFIPVSTLNVITAEELLKKGDEIDYVFDFVRLLTVVSAEQKFYRFGAFKRYICMEVIDHTAKMECVLYDEYVDVIQKYFTVHGRSRVIIVLQFVKLSLVGGVFFGKTVMQNMFAATRVFFNPVLTEVVDFRKSAALLGIDLEGRVGFLNRISPTVSMRDDFLILHPRKKICDLNVVSESFVCIIWAKVVKVINEGRWWYLECKCRKPVAAKDGIYHCTYCSRNVVNVIPRYKIKVEVYDFNDSAYLTLDDRDVERILKKSCKDLLDEVEDPLSCQIPMVIISLVGKQWLFKVLKISTSDGAWLSTSLSLSFAIAKLLNMLEPHVLALLMWSLNLYVRLVPQVLNLTCI